MGVDRVNLVFLQVARLNRVLYLALVVDNVRIIYVLFKVDEIMRFPLMCSLVYCEYLSLMFIPC